MNRHYPTWLILLQGLALGLIAFGVAELSLPGHLFDSGDHDMMVAQRLGLVYTPGVGAWLGWLQRSRQRTGVGALAGLGIGIAYFVLCTTKDFFAIMVAFPALLGGGLACAVGSSQSHGFAAFFSRTGQGRYRWHRLRFRVHVPSERFPEYLHFT